MYIVRYSESIEDDISRNWSPHGIQKNGICEDGNPGDEIDIAAARQKAFDEEDIYEISGIVLEGNAILQADIREFVPGNWVLVDDTDGRGNYQSAIGLFGELLQADNLDEAITEVDEAESKEYFEPYRFDASKAELVYSRNDIHAHIFVYNP